MIRSRLLQRTLPALLLLLALMPGFLGLPLPARAVDLPKPLFLGVTEGKTFSNSKEVLSDVTVNVGSVFTLSTVVKLNTASGVQVLFSKGPKTAGHFELWVNQGILTFYAPDINGGGSINTDVDLSDLAEHHVTFVSDGSHWYAYRDSILVSSGTLSGSVASTEEDFVIGGLVTPEYPANAYLKNVRIDSTALTAEQVAAISDGHIGTEEKQEPVTFPYRDLDKPVIFTAASRPLRTPNFNADLGACFTVAVTVKATTPKQSQVLFAKGEKTTGHFELWINPDGMFEFYAPDLFGGTSIATDVYLPDNQTHHVAFTFNEGLWHAYLDGYLYSMGVASGSIAPTVGTFTVGGLNDGGFPFRGTLSDLYLDNRALNSSEIYELASVKGQPKAPYTPKVHTSTYDPEKYQPTEALRGTDRLTEPVALPLLDTNASVGYEGSIDKTGGNGDFAWTIYQDEKDEWVLFESYGPGCLYNFTQHRFPNSKDEVVFRFYIDDSDTPAFEIKQSEFGKKAPFLSPLADIYKSSDGPGAIWVVRSFVPMVYTSYCKVTSSHRLDGGNGISEGGWGHVTYVSYDSTEGIKVYDTAGMTEELETLNKKVNNLSFDPKYNKENVTTQQENVTVPAGGSVTLLDTVGSGAVAAVKLTVAGRDATHDMLANLRYRMYWDGSDTPAVDAPVGTLFGCEYGYFACDNTLLMLGAEIAPGEFFRGYNYFPMPFFASARIELYNVGGAPITVTQTEIQVTPSSVVSYDPDKTGYFTSSAYYPKTPNQEGKTTVIGTLEGTGHMVYGVVSGYNILIGGCEGDVRIYFDGKQSPEIQSDGSESWASYGAGFITPPQVNPFSAYNGADKSSVHWSEVRLTLGDSYYFKNSIRFELEHGGINEGLGYHSGQFFCYLVPSVTRETDSLQVTDPESADAHRYTVTGNSQDETLRSSYATGFHTSPVFSDKIKTGFDGSISFTVKLDPENTGVLLLRTASQKLKRQAATVAVDGVTVSERIWYALDGNTNYAWRDDSFFLPASYTADKSEITVTITPLDLGGGVTWNESAYRVLSVGKHRASVSVVPGLGDLLPGGNGGDAVTDRPSDTTGGSSLTGDDFPWYTVLAVALPVVLVAALLLGVLAAGKRKA